MRLPAKFSVGGRDSACRESAFRESALRDLPPDLAASDLLAGEGPWEVELGFGKGRYLLRSAAERPDRRFLGIELASRYFRLAQRRASRKGLRNLVLIRGEALYLLSAVLPRAFASVLHVYFPDPWPKSRHTKRRLFDPETVDLVIGVLVPGGTLHFATDFIDYGERVADILEGFPGLDVDRRTDPWPDGARTHYEAKYMAQGRPILRLSARLADRVGPRPRGASGIVSAWTRKDDG